MFTNTIQNFNEQAKLDAIKHCRSCLPNEGCGIFSNDKFIPFENKAENPKNEFIINDDEFDKLLMDDKIQCIIHSHNEFPHASINDREQQIALDIPFGIINFRKGTAEHFIFWGDGIEIEPLLKRPFFFGVFDCLKLAEDYIFLKFQKKIEHQIVDINYWKKDQPVFEENLKSDKYPGYQIDINEAKEHDFYLYKMANSKFINHIGIIIENNRVLHHFVNKVSCRLPASYYQQEIVAACRFDQNWEGYND